MSVRYRQELADEGRHTPITRQRSPCVPGHYEDYSDRVGEWLRLHVHATGHDSWQKDDYVADATVVLNVAAARALRDEIDAWLSLPKARRRRGSA